MKRFLTFFLLLQFLFLQFSCSENLDDRTPSKDDDLSDNEEVKEKENDLDFSSNDRDLNRIMLDFTKPIKSYPSISSKEAITNEAGMTYREGIDEPFTGTIRDFYPNGQIALESSYMDGLPHGLQIKNHENGQRSMEVLFDKGILAGVTTRWWENGQIRSEEYWSNGSFYGRKIWDETGRVIKEERKKAFP